MNETRAVLILILGTAALRVGFASIGELGFDESYMVSNARIFALSYVDAPPLHVWMVGGWARLLGSENPMLLRLPFIAFFAGSTWLMYRLTAQLFSARAGLWAALLLNLAPVLTLAHATWVLPDGPLIFFMLATASIVAGILFSESPPSRPILWWIAAGVCGGLACLSKFHGAFLFLAVFVFLITVPEQRRWLATPGPWLGVLAAIIVFSPAIVWNLQHGFLGVVFQADRLSGSSGLTLRYLPQSIGGQALYLAPWLIVPLAYYLARALWHGPAAPKSWFLALLAIGPIAVFTGAAFFARNLPHWQMPGWVFAFPLMGQAWVSLALSRPKFVRYGAILAALAPALVVAVLWVQIANGTISRTIPSLFPSDPTLDLLQWAPLAAALAERRLLGPETPAVAAIHWSEAGKINLAIGKTIPVLCLCADPQQFAYLHQPTAFVGRNLILVGTQGIMADVERLKNASARFERVEPLAPVILRRGGEPAIELQLFRGINFKG